ncbi:hypothetical protein RB195_022553 [Necator americanus]|uniref:Uncharacterized protein n=1 Tax=Necator americanus TaxID=51031 RepID=A0ABR1EGD4_NECAM
MEEQFSRHHGPQKRSYHKEALVWKTTCGEDTRTTCVEKSTGELAVRRLKVPTAVQPRRQRVPLYGKDDRQQGKCAMDNVERGAQTIVLPTTTRPPRQSIASRSEDGDVRDAFTLGEV